MGQSAAFIGKNPIDNIAPVSSLDAVVFNFTDMLAMSHRSDVFLACSSEVNISEPALCLTIMYSVTVTQIVLSRVQFPMVMSDTKSLYTTLPEVMISSNTYLSLFVIKVTLLYKPSLMPVGLQ
jgi:hypothetical protein